MGAEGISDHIYYAERINSVPALDGYWLTNGYVCIMNQSMMRGNT